MPLVTLLHEDCSKRDRSVRNSPNRKDLGFMMIVTAASLFVFVGMLGLAADLGRVFIVKSEAQAFADLGSLAAARHLNGKQTGITAAQTEVTNSTYNKWNFGTQSFPASVTTVEFSTAAAGPWSAAPGSAANVAFVRLTVTPSVPLSFMPVLGTATTQTVMGRAIAGVVPQQFPLGGYLPFTPFAHNNADSNFGYTVGQSYAFLWPGNVKQQDACAGDQNPWPMYNMSDQVGGSTRGYFELQAASAIADAILGGKQTMSLSVGDILTMTNGQKQAEQNALMDRVGFDTDQTAYEQNLTPGTAPPYAGNGMRLVVMPVNSGPNAVPAYQVLGFSAWLLPMSYPNGGNKAWCAIYMGSRTAGGDTGNPFNVAGAYVVRLQQ